MNKTRQFLLLLTAVTSASGQSPDKTAAAHGDGPSEAVPAAPNALRLERAEVAKGPLVRHPVALDVDEHGRVFVAETDRYERRGISQNRGRERRVLDDLRTFTLEERGRTLQQWLDSGELDEDIATRKELFGPPPEGRKSYLTKFSDGLACLVDVNSDGIADRRSEFANGFNQPLDGPAAGVLTWDGKVWFTCIPSLWLLEDTDRDLRADRRTVLVTGFGIRASFFGHDLHGLALGMDGRIYFSAGDRGFHVRTKEGRTLSGADTGGVFRCWPDGSDLELYARGLRNPQELAFDDFGNLFTGDNNCDAGDKARIECIVEGGEYGWEMSVQDLPHRGPWMRENMWKLRPAPDDVSYPAWILPPLAHLGAGPSGLASYPGVGLPEKYRGHFFMCDFRGGGNGSILAFRCLPDGAGFKVDGAHVFDTGAGVADVAFGYDGRLYVADWGNAWEANDAGRIYSLAHPESRQLPAVEEVRKLAPADFSKFDARELCRLLDHADRRIRMKAQFALAGKKASEVLERLLAAARKAETLTGRIHALWAVGIMARNRPVLLTEVTGFLEDEDAEMRAQAARLLGDARHAPAAPRLAAALRDPSIRVRMAAALALSRVPLRDAVDPLLDLAGETADKDAFLRHAVVMGLAGCATAADLAAKGRTHPSRSARLAAVLALRKLAAPELAEFLTDVDPQVIAEAVRAIYDLQIVAALPAAAALLDRTEFPEGLRHDGVLRRAIEANRRIGGAEQAECVAAFAALPPESGVPDTFRLLALEALATWNEPPPRDDVWGRWMPLPARAAGLARPAIQRHLPALIQSAKGPVLAKAREVETKFGAEKSPDNLLKLAKDESLGESLRLDCLKTLGVRGQPAEAQLDDACRFILASRNSPPPLRMEARGLLMKRQPASALALVQDALIAGSPMEKQAAVTALAHLRSSEAEKKLLELGQSLAAGTLDPVIQVEVMEAVRHRDEKRSPWRKILEHWDETLAGGEADPLAMHRMALSGGDAAAGRLIFQNHQTAQCLRCHSVRGQGGTAGPDLNGIATRHDAAYLLESLIVPSAKIVDGYAIVTATLEDGKTISGILLSRDAEHTSILEGTTPRQIRTAEIKDLTSPLSAMPPMGALLTPRELRDLMAYLQTLK